MKTTSPKKKKRPQAGQPRELSVTAGSAPSPMRWEYLTEHCRNGYISNDRLAELGERRWEMCATVATPDRASDLSSAWPSVVVFYFKRALLNNKVTR